MRGSLLLVASALLALAATAGPAGAPAPVPANTPETAPLLAWGDDPPTVEVRGLSGSRTITVRYGAIDPATFFITLDGDAVTALFHPAPNTEETVELPFIGGRNRLLMGASSADRSVHIGLDRVIVFAKLPADAAVPEGARLHSAPELKHELWLRKNPPAATPATKGGPAPAAAPSTAAPAATPPAAAPSTKG